MTDEAERGDADRGEHSRRAVLGVVAAAGIAGVALGGRVGRPRSRQDDADGDVVLASVAEGFTAPVGLETAPEERDRLFVVDRPGRVHVVEDDARREEPFLDIAGRVVDRREPPGGDVETRGLLGLAFHPGFAENRRLFVRFSAPPREGTPPEYDHTVVVAEFRAAADGGRADPASGRPLLEVPSPGADHNGHRISFGPDGHLLVPLGDGGGEGDAGPGHAEDWYEAADGGNGQDVTENLLGSVLRLDVNGGGGGEGDPYAVPDDNPLVDAPGLDEQYAWGFRAPRHLSVAADGRVFVTEAGGATLGEVNRLERGGNYGWNVREGTRCFGPGPTGVRDCPGHAPDHVRGGEPLLDPVVEYPEPGSDRDPAEGDGRGPVLVGGHVHEGGEGLDHLAGRFVFATRAGRLLAATPPSVGTPTPTPTPPATPTGTPTPSVPAAYELDATADGWQGRSPPAIEAELNPTLRLVPGRTHEITWRNLDGEPHNVALVDDAGDVVVASQVVRGRGMTQTFEFEATSEMAAYVCELHPTRKRGEVELVGGGSGGNGEGTGDGDGGEGNSGDRLAAAGAARRGPHDGREQWRVEVLSVAGTASGRVDGRVRGVGRDDGGTLYVLTDGGADPEGGAGAVHRVVPAAAGGSGVD